MASSSSSSHRSKYQVFLSFRGEDTRHNFTSYLLEALKDRGIIVFFDEEKLEMGAELTPSLLDAITASKVSIIILSKDYASSKSCLTELSKIWECKHNDGQHVLPIFYKVDPSDVRHCRESFEKSFNQHLNGNRPEELVERWKAAFAQVGSLKGWHIEGGNFDRSETQYIKEIVEVVIEKLSGKATYRSQGLVGLDDQIEKILLLIEEEHIRVIGIWGMGGIGKTTLAEAVCNEKLCDSKFDAHYFLQDVRERSLEKYGMKSLQDELLSRLLKGDIHIDTPFIGSTLILDRLRNVRVFVVFDDVDNNSDQIRRLVENFAPRSKFIVTSRDQQVLKNIGVDEDHLHRVRKLNGNDSLQLFCKFAFKQDNPVGDFGDLAMRFVRYCGGNPLALKVLGAALYKKSRVEWESALDKLKEYPEQHIHGALRISYDGLDDLEKNIFLDIACLSPNKNEVKCIYKLGVEFVISRLLDKCLAENSYGKLGMHELLVEMGRNIVQKESEDPGRRSRLWEAEDVCHVLKNNTGTRSVKGISLSHLKEPQQISPAAFENMVNLVFIKFEGSSLLLPQQYLTYLPNTLRYLQWDYCPLKFLPSNFSIKNLVELRLSHSDIEQLWNGDQNLVNLRVMLLYMCQNLRNIPNLSRATKLEILWCLDCRSITKFPEIAANRALEVLNLGGTQIQEVPSFIGTKIRRLDLDGCSNLTEVNISGGLHESLRSLVVANCKCLKSLSGLPLRMEYLNASGCTSLERVSFLVDANHCCQTPSVLSDPAYSFVSWYFRDSFTLSQDARNNITAMYLMMTHSMARQCAKQEGGQKIKIDLPGAEIPDLFENQSSNSSLTVKLHPAIRKRFLCFALGLVRDVPYPRESHFEYQLKGINGVQNFEMNELNLREYASNGEQLTYLFDSCMVHTDLDYTEASFDVHQRLYSVEVKKWGVHVFYVDAEGLTIWDVGTSSIINCSSDHVEYNRCSPSIIELNSDLVGPSWLSPVCDVGTGSISDDEDNRCTSSIIQPNSNLVDPSWLSLGIYPTGDTSSHLIQPNSDLVDPSWLSLGIYPTGDTSSHLIQPNSLDGPNWLSPIVYSSTGYTSSHLIQPNSGPSWLSPVVYSSTGDTSSPNSLVDPSWLSPVTSHPIQRYSLLNPSWFSPVLYPSTGDTSQLIQSNSLVDHPSWLSPALYCSTGDTIPHHSMRGRSYRSNDEGDHEPNKRVKLF